MAATDPAFTMSYEALVEAGRAAREQADNMQWVEGDLALQVEALPAEEMPRDPETGQFLDPEKGLKVYAEDVGVPYGTVRDYRRTAEAWPVAERSATVPWAVHKVLNAQEDRFSLLREEMTYRDAQKIVRKRNAATSGKPGWVELVGHVGGDLRKAEKWLTKAENAIDREPNKKLRDQAERYAGWAEDIAARLRRLGFDEST